jgi:hypothetical protein
MQRFITQTLFICSLISLVFVSILSRADGYTDPFYVRFTSPKQESLILGSSRAAQGLQPSVFKDYLKRDVFNYSFTISHSPYGAVYLNSIKKKLNKNTTNGIFIITVDPWSISSKTKDPNDSINFGENKLCLANTYLVNMNPNFEYLIRNFAGKYYTLIQKKRGSLFLNNDGWLEVNIGMDSSSVAKRIDAKVYDYKTNNLPFYNFSSLRLEYLYKTIQLLQQHGDVYLVRLPVHPKIFEIEQELMPDFDRKISEVVTITDGYIDMTKENESYQYIDGNHLYKESGKLVSAKIGKWITESRKSKIETTSQ